MNGRHLCGWFAAAVACFALGCESSTLRFERSGLGGLSNSDELEPERDAASPSGVAASNGAGAMSLDAGLEFTIGPPCPELPTRCDDDVFDKCTLVDGDTGLRAACVQERGTLALGAPCERIQRGHDDCAAGSFCTPIGIGTVEDGPMVCRELCLDNAECGPQRCLELELAGVGLCVDECRVLSDDCGELPLRCAAGADLAGRYFGYCSRSGDVAVGESCASDADCVPEAVCQAPDGVCRQLCDAENPCDGTLRCVPLGLADPASPRVCLP